MVRITGGAERGRNLRAPRGRSIRPTAAKVREAIFDILAARYGIEGRNVMDLFAGSGLLGLEALSRGAVRALFIDSSGEACRLVRENARSAGFGDRADVRRLRLPSGLTSLRGPFGGALLDPPYGHHLLPECLVALSRRDLLDDSAWVVAEHARQESLADRYGRLERTLTRSYGDTEISVYEVTPA